MIEAGDEALRRAGPAGFSDSVTFAFADAAAELYGSARIGVTPGSSPQASALAMLFEGSTPVAARAEGGVSIDGASWEAIEVAGVRAAIVEPLRLWRVAFAVEGAAFELDFHATGGPVEVGLNDASVRAGGPEGYEFVCRVEGTATVGGRSRRVSGLGERAHLWGVADWERVALTRTLSAWWDEDRALAVSAVRPAGARTHAEEAVTAHLLDDGEVGDVLDVLEPRLSTTYDAEGRQRRAGLELWLTDDDELPRRVSGEVACGSSLELGRLHLDCAFFRWRTAGRTGLGRYDVLRRA